MNKKLHFLFLILSVFLAISLAEQALAIQPEVRNVVAYDSGGSTLLNITVYHYPEDGSIPHYVNTIEVTMGTNTTDMTIGVQPLSGENTFNVTYNLGPVSGTPTITVKAHCLVNGWSTPNDWTGTVPEFSFPTLFMALALCTLLAAYGCRRAKKGLQV